MMGLKVAVLARLENSSEEHYSATRDISAVIAGANHAVLISEELINPKYQSPSEDPAQTVSDFPYRSHIDPKANERSIDVAGDWRSASNFKSMRESLDRRSDVAVLMPGTGLEELSQAIYMARRGTPLIVMNDDGYFDGLKKQIEQVRDNLGEMNDGNGSALDNWDNISFVTMRSSVLSLVAQWHEEGVPDQAREDRRNCEHNAHILLRDKSGDKQVDFSVEHKNGRAVGLLHAGSTLEGIDRLLSDMTTHNTLSVIDNSDGYHAGIINQFDTFVDDGAEAYDSVFEKARIAENASEAKSMRADVFFENEPSQDQTSDNS